MDPSKDVIIDNHIDRIALKDLGVVYPIQFAVDVSKALFTQFPREASCEIDVDNVVAVAVHMVELGEKVG